MIHYKRITQKKPVSVLTGVTRHERGARADWTAFGGKGRILLVSFGVTKRAVVTAVMMLSSAAEHRNSVYRLHPIALV